MLHVVSADQMPPQANSKPGVLTLLPRDEGRGQDNRRILTARVPGRPSLPLKFASVKLEKRPDNSQIELYRWL